MEIFSLSFLLVAITVLDEVINGQLKIAHKLHHWLEKKVSGSKKATKS